MLCNSERASVLAQNVRDKIANICVDHTSCLFDVRAQKASLERVRSLLAEEKNNVSTLKTESSNTSIRLNDAEARVAAIARERDDLVAERDNVVATLNEKNTIDCDAMFSNIRTKYMVLIMRCICTSTTTRWSSM